MISISPQAATDQDPQARYSASSARVDVFFTPDEDATAKILSAIAKAKQEIRVQAYLFTSRKIANALIRAHGAGVSVEVIVDREQMERDGTPMVGELTAAGVPVFVDGVHAAAHNKIILIDSNSERPVVVTGSYNFTVAAQTKNAENVLIIRNNRQLARNYHQHYEEHRLHSVRMQ